MRHFLIAAALLAPPVWAHEYDEATVSRVGRMSGGPTVEVIVGDTVAGRLMVCALYSDGEVVQSATTVTSDLATKALMNYRGEFDTARCVYSDR